ncbi:MAG: 23S rRNA (guanosine(2251)-2'-O)-methyltransferase RlmB [Saprospiraceae bacterium]|nr:23S rRNA (guanosine(2251)-2'-O)-methyltransferase RlmB [Saprospiraceae bacterium]
MNDKSEWIPGKNALKEALAAGTLIQKVYLSETLERETLKELTDLCKKSGLSVISVPKFKLDKLSGIQHQGVLAHISPVEFYKALELADRKIEEGITPCFVVLDSITDVRNFGAIARSAEVFGIDGLIIGQKNSSPINQDAIKTSSGALLRIPICKETNLQHTLRELKKRGFRIIGADEKASSQITDMDMNQAIVFVMGSEGTGISKDLNHLIDVHVRIPQKGKINSLNVSVSAGIIFYHWSTFNT